MMNANESKPFFCRQRRKICIKRIVEQFWRDGLRIFRVPKKANIDGYEKYLISFWWDGRKLLSVTKRLNKHHIQKLTKWNWWNNWKLDSLRNSWAKSLAQNQIPTVEWHKFQLWNGVVYKSCCFEMDEPAKRNEIIELNTM